MHLPTSDSNKPDHSRLAVASVLVVIFGLLFMVLRITQQNYMMAIGAVWVANGLTMVLHALYWQRYGLSGAYKVAVVAQGLITIAPLLFGQSGLALILFMLGGEIRFW